ncbi:flagellar biosynthetic protein FliQ [Alsobacter soli]|uniref:Flagellar biosynthetic protein FliQ n=1 Tax=Alsobacter soli TaxID=2109933 RepID=A0A2T1HRE3_9HYPH|nr:flagellar biosynthetic protein FliQ [Alsobacter soli]PSC04234.1 flagellar biosynthetic protein FliQ [Alsobacter soli]
MSGDALYQLIYECALAVAVAGAPLLAAATVAGLLISVFQAATQIQDQSLTLVVKIVVMGGLLFMAFATLLGPLVEFSRAAFEFAKLKP